MADNFEMKEVQTKSCGVLKVFIQGNLTDKKTVFVTCHDMGTNHSSWNDFISHPTMAEVCRQAAFVHICIPGQENNADTWPDSMKYPSLNEIGSDIATVLNTLNVTLAIGIGDGAGANIICRFAIQHPNLCLGVILIHCTSTTAGVMEYIKDKVIQSKLKDGMNQTAWEYLVLHKFGHAKPSNANEEDYLTHLKQNMNPVNLAHFLTSFLSRTDLSNTLAVSLKCEALLVVGSKASHLHTVQTMSTAMSRQGSSLLIVDNVGDVITEAPQKLSRALILFCKGCGALASVGIPGLENARGTASISMEDADKPGQRKLSTLQ